nr:hypothetical protein [Synechococcus sp. CBW1004]
MTAVSIDIGRLLAPILKHDEGLLPGKHSHCSHQGVQLTTLQIQLHEARNSMSATQAIQLFIDGGAWHLNQPNRLTRGRRDSLSLADTAEAISSRNLREPDRPRKVGNGFRDDLDILDPPSAMRWLTA